MIGPADALGAPPVKRRHRLRSGGHVDTGSYVTADLQPVEVNQTHLSRLGADQAAAHRQVVGGDLRRRQQGAIQGW